MCEPNHSILQYEDPDDKRDDDSDGNEGFGGPTAQTARETFLGRLGKWLRKFGRYQHLSVMGKGHTEAQNDVSPFAQSYILGDHAKFETAWWNRIVTVDTSSEYMKRMAYARSESGRITTEPYTAATQYAEAVCIGNIGLLRRFLEASMESSDRPLSYFAKFTEMLDRAGRVQLEAKTNMFFGRNAYRSMFDIGTNQGFGIGSTGKAVMKRLGITTEQVTKLMLGFTRKRSLLVPVWADHELSWR